jgi:hypothetical protein
VTLERSVRHRLASMLQKQDTQYDKFACDKAKKCLLAPLTERSIGIKGVPPEILSRIFILMANSYPGPDMANPLEFFNLISRDGFTLEEEERAGAVEEVRRLATVCRTWGDIINGTPQLWTNFRFLFAIRERAEDRKSYSFYHLTRTCLHLISAHQVRLSRERSKTRVLDWWLDLRLLSSVEEFMTIWVQFVQPALPQLGSLTFLGHVTFGGKLTDGVS